MSLNQYGWFLDGYAAGLVFPVSAGVVLPAGGYYFEMTINGSDVADGGGGVGAGIANSSVGLGEIVDAAVNGSQASTANSNFINMIVDTSGATAASPEGYPARPEGSSGALVTGTVYGFAVDTPHKKIWWRNVTRNSSYSGDGTT